MKIHRKIGEMTMNVDKQSSIRIVVTGDPSGLSRQVSLGRPGWDSHKELRYKWERLLSEQIKQPVIYIGPWHLDVDFFFAIPRNSGKHNNEYHTVKPEMNYLLRFVEEVIKGVIISKDCIITSIVSRKFYGDVPRTEITLRYG
jgi:Holliday junction resolvase RusA-like endonuclease